MKKYCFFIFFCFLFASQAFAGADLAQIKILVAKKYSPLVYKTVQGNVTASNTLDANMDKAVRLIISSPESDVTPWLQKNVGKYCPKYIFAFAARLAREKAPVDEFLFWRLAALYRARMDASLCRDKSVLQYVGVLRMDFLDSAEKLYSGTSLLEEYHKHMGISPEGYAKRLKEWDAANPSGVSPDWICKSGQALESAKSYPKSQWAKRRAEFRNTYFQSVVK